MKNHSDYLMQIAKDFVHFHNEQVVHAYVYGSVARKDADQYSDIDLTIYSNQPILEEQHTVEIGEEVIQVTWCPKEELPDENHVESDPWGHRFLTEIVLLKDYGGKLERVRDRALTYFESMEGQEKMFHTVSRIVEQRITFAKESLQIDQPYTATNAAMGAWSEAAFLVQYLDRKSVSTGDLIPYILTNADDEKQFSEASLIHDYIPGDPSRVIRSLRDYISENRPYNDITSEIHDHLCDKKAVRLLENNEFLNLNWQMYGEALWLYFEMANGVPFEEYYQDLPPTLQNELTEIGFNPLTPPRLNEINRWTQELLLKSERLLNR